MSMWKCVHLDGELAAETISDGHRFLVRLREPVGDRRCAIEFYRWTLRDAMKAADRLVQAYYPHACTDDRCGHWHKL